MSCSRTQHSDTSEAPTCGPSVSSQAQLPMSHCTQNNSVSIVKCTGFMANSVAPDQTVTSYKVSFWFTLSNETYLSYCLE